MGSLWLVYYHFIVSLPLDFEKTLIKQNINLCEEQVWAKCIKENKIHGQHYLWSDYELQIQKKIN